MEKKRSNKKLFAIIGGSVLAFILTIALSVSITLAYFGDTQTGSAKLTLNDPVLLGVGDAVTAEASLTVVPTQFVEVEATADIIASSTPSLLFAYTSVTAAEKFVMDNAEFDEAWVEVGKVGENILYAYSATAKNANTLDIIIAESTTDITMTYSFQVDPDIKNWSEDTDPTKWGTAPTVDVAVTFVRVQQVYTGTGVDDQELSVKASDYQAALTQVIGSAAGTVTVTGASAGTE